MPNNESGNSDEYRAGWYRKDGKRIEEDFRIDRDERRGGRSYWGPGGHSVGWQENLEKTNNRGGDYLREYFGAPFRSENEKYENPGLGRNYSPRDEDQEDERAQFGDRPDQPRRRKRDGGRPEGSRAQVHGVLEGSLDLQEKRDPRN